MVAVLRGIGEMNIEKIEAAALAATNGCNGIERLGNHAEMLKILTPAVVIDLINRLRAAEKLAKSWEDQANVLATQDNKLIEEMTQQAIEAEEAITELYAKLEAAEKDAAVGNWLCSYMASETVDHDDYLVEACYENNPEKFKLAVIAAMKEKP